MKRSRVSLWDWEAKAMAKEMGEGIAAAENRVLPPLRWAWNMRLWAAMLMDRVRDPEANPVDYNEE